MLSRVINMRLKHVALGLCIISFVSVLIFYALLPQNISSINKGDFLRKKKNHRSLALDEDDMVKVADLSDKSYFKETLLKPMLRTRVPGTPGNQATQEHITEFLTDYGWTIEKDSFEDSTPYGVKPFTNIIATQNPAAPRTLVLACHFDSKYFKEFDFIGATDSAVPCAMLLDLARSLTNYLKQNENFEVSLQFMFFDGEEAFKQWTDTDSLYGARHLAKKLQQSTLQVGREVEVTRLQTIDVLVLLDLIGAAHPTFKNWFDKDTGKIFKQMSNIENLLKQSQRLDTDDNYRPYFDTSRRYLGSGIQDDHIPFLQKKVPVVHLISSPFPFVWHKESDNEHALDYPTIDNLNKILRIFVAQYLNLKPLL